MLACNLPCCTCPSACRLLVRGVCENWYIVMTDHTLPSVASSVLSTQSGGFTTDILTSLDPQALLGGLGGSGAEPTIGWGRQRCLMLLRKLGTRGCYLIGSADQLLGMCLPAHRRWHECGGDSSRHAGSRG